MASDSGRTTVFDGEVVVVVSSLLLLLSGFVAKRVRWWRCREDVVVWIGAGRRRKADD